MKKLVFILISLTIYSLPLNMFGQPKESGLRKRQIYLNEEKPTVYITYERSGKLKPLYASESENRIWLRLHNNSRWSLLLAATGGDDKAYGDVSLFYDIDEIQSEINNSGELNKQNPPVGRPLNHTFSVVQLPSGKSVLFSVPKEHIGKGLILKVRFAYEWEGDDSVSANDEPKHYVYFYSTDLPSDIANP